jgi:hypothetical protein
MNRDKGEAPMKQRMLNATACVLFAMICAREATACGDKLLVVGRGARFQRGYVAVHPTSVLLVDPNGATSSDVMASLRRAGHRVDVVKDSTEVRGAVAANKYEIVLADWSRASDIQPAVSSAAPSVLFLPLLDGASDADVAAATKLYRCALQSDKKKAKRSFLARLDEAIDAKRKSKPVQCNLK